LSLAREEKLDGMGDVGEAVGAIKGFDKALGKFRAIHSVQGGYIEHFFSCFLKSSVGRQPRLADSIPL
jgi:hypothetical protein